jgi:ATP-dependent DNA ligase
MFSSWGKADGGRKSDRSLLFWPARCDRPKVDLPLSQRRAELQLFLRKAGVGKRIQLSRSTRSRQKAQRWLAGEGYRGTDGVIAKLLDGPYQPGQRAMVKVKRQRIADCVVGGYRYLSHRHGVGSLLLGLYDRDGRLDHVGFTSTIRDADRLSLTRRLEALRAPPGFTGKAPGGPSRWSTERRGAWQPVRPELVVCARRAWPRPGWRA